VGPVHLPFSEAPQHKRTVRARCHWRSRSRPPGSRRPHRERALFSGVPRPLLLYVLSAAILSYVPWKSWATCPSFAPATPHHVPALLSIRNHTLVFSCFGLHHDHASREAALLDGVAPSRARTRSTWDRVLTTSTILVLGSSSSLGPCGDLHAEESTLVPQIKPSSHAARGHHALVGRHGGILFRGASNPARIVCRPPVCRSKSLWHPAPGRGPLVLGIVFGSLQRTGSLWAHRRTSRSIYRTGALMVEP